MGSNKVFLIHGRNHQAKEEFKKFLLSLNLNPIDTEYVRRCLPAPVTILDLVINGMKLSDYVVALFTGDEWSVLRPEFREASDVDEGRWQARPNVIFEAGLAYGQAPERMIFVKLGGVELFSDTAGLHEFRPTNDYAINQPRHTLREALKKWFFENTGFEIPENENWKTEGDFEKVVPRRSRPLDPFLPT